MKNHLINRKSPILICSYLLALAILCYDTNLSARPCNKAQLSVHKMMANKEQCFQPDPHPMPYGISYHTGDRIAHTYVYFINSSGKPINLTTVYMEPPDNELSSYPVGSLPAQGYTWNIPTNTEIVFSQGTKNISFEEGMTYLKKEGPAIHRYYNIIVIDGKLTINKICEKQAIELLKNMKYYQYSKLPGGNNQ